MATARKGPCIYYWDSVLHAMEYELRSLSTSFPMTPARIENFCDVIVKVPAASSSDFKRVMEGLESANQIRKWEAVMSYMQKNPRVVTPIWNHLSSQMKQASSTKEIKELQGKLKVACVKYNKMKTSEINNTDIIDNVEQMAHQISSILEQENISRNNVVSVQEELNKFSTLDCRFQRLGDFYDKEIHDMKKELESANKKSEEKMSKINDQMKKHIAAKEKLDENYQNAERKIAELEAKTKTLHKNQFEEKTGKENLAKMFQSQKQTLLDLRNDNVKLRAEVEHLNLTTNQVLTENIHLAEAMTETKKEMREEIQNLTARFDGLSGTIKGTINDKLDVIMKNMQKE